MDVNLTIDKVEKHCYNPWKLRKQNFFQEEEMGSFLQGLGLLLMVVALIAGLCLLIARQRKQWKSGPPSQVHGVYPNKRRY